VSVGNYASSKKKFVVSAGCVVCRITSAGALQVLLVGGKASEHSYRGFPKGRLNDGESPEMAALRETREETGLRTELLALAGISHYEFISLKGNEVYKTVRFYLARAIGGSTSDKDNEHYDVIWIEADEAQRSLSYRADQQIMRNARLLIEHVPLYRELLTETAADG